MFERRSRIIRDGSTLSFDYVPEKLHCREEEMAQLERMFSPLALDGRSCSAFLWGGVGAGKTVTAKRFCMDMAAYFHDKGKRMGYIYVNCRLRNTEYSVALDMMRHYDSHFPERGFAIDEILSLFRKKIVSEKTDMVVVLDEVDVLLKNRAKDLVYQLTRFSEGLPDGCSLSLILISQYSVSSLLDEASMSTFRRANMISFERYKYPDLQKIIAYRADLAMEKDVLDQDGVDLIAKLSEEYGDARFAIEVLERSAHVAEQSGESIITIDSIRTAGASIYSDVSEVKLKNLDMNKKIALLAISRAIRSAPSISMTKCEKTYAVVCEEYNVPAKKHTQFYTYVQDMERQTLLRTEVRREPDGGRVTYIAIDNIPPKELAKKIEYLLDYEARGERDIE